MKDCKRERKGSQILKQHTHVNSSFITSRFLYINKKINNTIFNMLWKRPSQMLSNWMVKREDGNISTLSWTFFWFHFPVDLCLSMLPFFSWTDKNKLHVLASSLWATSHLMWPLLLDTAVLPEEGDALARKPLLWSPRTVVHPPPQNKFLLVRRRLMSHISGRALTDNGKKHKDGYTWVLRPAKQLAPRPNVCEKPIIWDCERLSCTWM